MLGINPYQHQNLYSKLSIIALMILGFWAFGQVWQKPPQTELSKTEALDMLFGKLYDFSDSTLYVQRLDSFQSINNQLVNDSVRYFYKTLYNYCKAQLEIEKRHYAKAEPILEQNISAINPNFRINTLNIFYNLSYQWLGEIKKSQGKYQEAIEAFRNSIVYEDGAPYSIAATEKLIGETYALQDNWKSALLFYRKSLNRLLAYYPKATMPQDKIETQKRLIRVYEAISSYFRLHNDIDSAKYYLDLRRPFLAVNTESNMIDSYLLDGLVRSETGIYESAKRYYNKALHLAKTQRDLIKIAEIYRNRAEVYFKQGMYRVAVIDADSALFSLPQQTNSVFKKDYVQALSLKIDALTEAYRLEKQNDTTQLKNIFSLSYKNTQIIDSVMIEYQNMRDKQTLIGLQRSTFRHGLWAAATLFEKTQHPIYLTQAFLFSEKSRSATMRSISHLDKIRSFSGVPDSIIQKEDAFRQKIAALEHSIRLGNTIGGSAQTLYDLQLLKKQYRLFLNEIEKMQPQYFALKYQTQVFDPARLTKNLTNQNLLEFFLSKDVAYGFLWTKNGLKIQQLDITEEVANAQVTEILHFIKGEQENKAAYQQTAYFLYQKLIAPFEASLSEEIVIIPDGSLTRLPFETLLYEPSDAQVGVAKLPYWIKKHTISYHYAATLIFEEKRDWQKETDWAIFAPNFKDEPDFQDKSTLAFFEKNIKKEYIFKENQATKANFKAKMTDCRVLHINTHGIANDSMGDFSYLRLSDGNFYSGELYANKIKADLVTLSACQTANGELRQGEGIVGLTLGFLYAGAKSVVSSLWNVNQQSTSSFIQQFYQRLLEQKQPNNRALRAAKLAIIEENPNLAHPKYWAAFVLVGEPNATVENTSHWVWKIALLIIIVGTIWFIFEKYNKRN